MKWKIVFATLLIGITSEGALQAGVGGFAGIKDNVSSDTLKKFSTYTRKINPSTYHKTRLRKPVDV